MGLACDDCDGRGGFRYAMVFTANRRLEVYIEDWALEHMEEWLS